MDKNMINIDDLVRSRLAGAEEREPAGSWHSMRDLLDKEMPVKTAAFNWRRMMLYATAVVVASTLSVGGYKLYKRETTAHLHSMLHAGAADQANASKNNYKAINNNTPAIAVKDAATAGHSKTNTYTSTSVPQKEALINRSGNTAAGTTIAKGISPVTDKRRGSNNGSPATAVIHRNETTTAGNSQSTTPVTGKALAMQTATGTTPQPAASRDVLVNHSGSEATAESNTKTATEQQSPVLNSKGNRSLPASGAIALSKPANRTPAPVTLQHTVAATGNNNPDVPKTGSGKTVQQTAAIIPAAGLNLNADKVKNDLAVKTKYIRQTDSINQIQVAYRRTLNPVTQKMFYRPDTISNKRIAIERIVPEYITAEETTTATGKSRRSKRAESKPAAESIAANNTPAPVSARVNRTEEVKPVAAVPAAAFTSAEAIDNDNNLVSLSKFRVSGKFNNMWQANADRFNAFVQNINITLAKAQFYAGITGGFNTTLFSANTLAGFQLGFTGLLAFNERWSIAADLKYNHRFNSASINDNYSQISNVIPGNTSIVNGKELRQYTWDEDKVSHYYNLTAVQTMEVPVTLRYNIGRMFGEAGLNIMYAFAINAEEVEHLQGNPYTVTKNIPVNMAPAESIGGGKMINPADFRSRLGMGYVLGAGYQCTPALNVNIRLLQQVWDNAASSGARKISTNLYQTPSIQFSMGYRFSQSKGR